MAYYIIIHDDNGNFYQIVDYELADPDIGIIIQQSAYLLDFRAGNSPGSTTLTMHDQYGRTFVAPLYVYGPFNFLLGISGAEGCKAELWDKDVITGYEVMAASGYINSGIVSFNNVAIDQSFIKIKTQTGVVRIFETMSSDYSGVLYEDINIPQFLCSDKVYESGGVSYVEQTANSSISQFQTLITTVNQSYSFDQSMPKPLYILANSSIPITGYTNVRGRIHVNMNSDHMDHLDDDVIIHEFGHFYMDEKYNLVGGAVSHSWTQSTDQTTAYKEGWATFFSSLVRGSASYHDSNPGTGDVDFNIESIGFTLPTPPSGNTYEAAVAGSFWDLTDSGVESNDIVSLNLNLIKNTLASIAGNSIDEFVTTWVQNSYPNAYTIFTHHGISYSQGPTPPSAPTGFTVSGSQGQHPTLSWNQNTESDMYRYDIYCDQGSGFYLLHSINHPVTSFYYTGITIGDIRFDPTHCFKVKAVNTSNLQSGFSTQACVGVESAQKGIDISSQVESLPADFEVSEAYPNPFNPLTSIRFQIPQDAHVSIIVYDIQGREVQILVNEKLGAGYYTTYFDGSKLSSGVYFYRSQMNEYISTYKIVLVK